MRRAIGYLGSAVLWIVVAVSLAIVVVPKFLDRIYYEGPISGHFDGAHFANPDGIDDITPPPGGARSPPLNMIVRFLLGTDDRPPCRIVSSSCRRNPPRGSRASAWWSPGSAMRPS
jgi:hypothetical protein